MATPSLIYDSKLAASAGDSLTYDTAPRDASGWPTSGKPGQDIIVANPMGLASVHETATDNAAYLAVREHLMNEGRVAGFPPLHTGNPPADARPTIVGGVYIPGRNRVYGVRDGIVRVETTDAPVYDTSPTPPSAPGQIDPTEHSTSRSFPAFIFGALLVGALVLWFYRKGRGEKTSLETVR